MKSFPLFRQIGVALMHIVILVTVAVLILAVLILPQEGRVND